MIARFTFAIVLLASSIAAMADTPSDLAGRFPADTLVFASRVGATAAAQKAADTSFGQFLADPEIVRFKSRICAAIDGWARRESAREKMPPEIYERGLRVVADLWRRPIAIGLIDINLTPNSADVHAALVCRAGSDAERLATDVLDLLRMTGAPLSPSNFAGHDFMELATPDDVSKLYIGAVGDYFLVLCGDRSKEVVSRIESGGANLNEHESLIAFRKRIPGDNATRSMMFFIDAGRLMAKAKASAGAIQGTDARDVEKIFELLNALGMKNLAGVCWESHYLQNGCYDALYLHTPGGGTGLLAKSGKPVAESDLALIPRNATWATAFNVQLADGFRQLLQHANSIGPDAAGPISEGMSMAAEMIGMPADEFLDLFDDTFILYDSPDNGGYWMTGAVLMAECRDADKVQTHITQLIRNIAKQIDDEAKVEVKSQDHHGTTIQFINVVGLPMPLAPAWAKHNDWLVMGLYPQMVSATLDRLAEGDLRKNSILSNTEFMQGRKVLGKLGSSATYVDTRDGLRTLYPFALALAQAGAAMAQAEGVDIDVTAIPSMRTIQKYMRSQVQFTQSFDDGMLSASYGAFPMGLNSVAPASLAVVPLTMGIAMPAMVAAREAGMEVAEARKSEVVYDDRSETAGYEDGRVSDALTVCDRNLRGIGSGMLNYAHGHGGKFPPSFQACIDDNENVRSQFVCPMMADRPMTDLESCYVLVKGQSTYDDPKNILVYERPANHSQEGIVHVVFVDGMVVPMTPDELDQKLDETAKRRGMPRQ